VLRKDVLWVGGSAGAAFALLGVLMITGTPRKPLPTENPAWNRGAIGATYVGSQLREIDKAHSSLIISYDLANDTDTDYRLADGPGVLILCRLRADKSLSQEQPVRLSYPVFLPAKQHARIAVEINEPFAWPTEKDPAYGDKVRDFIKRRLENIGEFVVFDEANRRQLELPGAWEALQDSSPANN